MSEFVCLFRIGQTEQREAMGTPERGQQSMQVWLAWMRELEAKGHLKNPGQPLGPAGKVVRGRQKAITEAHGRSAHADLRSAQPGARRRRRPGRLLPGAGGVEGSRGAGEPLGVAHGDGEAPRARHLAARAHEIASAFLTGRAAIEKRISRGKKALAALMCLHAARLPGRIDTAGDLSALVDQDRSRWDARLVSEGLALLELAAAGQEVTPYHIEAMIAAVHASTRTLEDTDWRSIVSLYDRLMDVAPSPIVALNRAIAIGQRDGAERGLEELHAIADRDRLAGYPFYPAALGELELRRGNRGAARRHFRAALDLARNGTERRFLDKRLRSCAGA